MVPTLQAIAGTRASAHSQRRVSAWMELGCIRNLGASEVYKFKFDLQPGSLTDQFAGEHQP